MIPPENPKLQTLETTGVIPNGPDLQSSTEGQRFRYSDTSEPSKQRFRYYRTGQAEYIRLGLKPGLNNWWKNRELEKK